MCSMRRSFSRAARRAGSTPFGWITTRSTRSAAATLAGKLGSKPDPDQLARQTFLIHNELPESFTAWRAEIGMADLEPAAIDHFDSGQIMLEAAAQGLGIAIMHDDHMRRAADNRLATLFDVEVESPYSYWFVCKPTALEERPVRLFHDWLVNAGL